VIRSDPIAVFGQTPSGDTVHRIALAGGGLSATVLTYGAIVQDLRLDGFDHPLVLGSDTLEPYFGGMQYAGAIVGRYANRIENGHFDIDGIPHRVSQNFLGKHCLHGGEVGCDQMVWAIDALSPDQVTLSLVLPDGHMGFPGELRITAKITLTADNAISFELVATTTAATPCCFAHHGYFNLDGSADITAHHLKIFADAFLPVDDECIPTGERRPLTGSAFDFRQPGAIGQRGLDHNFCLADGPRAVSPAAVLTAPANGLRLTVETTQPGLQVYDAAAFPKGGLPGLDGRRYGANAGAALETQAWPDAPNRPDFPNAILYPGEEYRHLTRYRFDRLT